MQPSNTTKQLEAQLKARKPSDDDSDDYAWVDELDILDQDLDPQQNSQEESKSEYSTLVTQGLTKKEIQFKKEVRKKYLERSKHVGRIGPPATELDLVSKFGEAIVRTDPLTSTQHKQDSKEPGLLLDVEANSNWVSIRANTAVFADRFYYEVQILTPGVMQIGWCTLQTQFSSHSGVGDDDTSYAYDGFRLVKWHHGQERFGKRWVTGDVIGTLIDLEKGTIRYW